MAAMVDRAYIWNIPVCVEGSVGQSHVRARALRWAVPAVSGAARGPGSWRGAEEQVTLLCPARAGGRVPHSGRDPELAD